MAAKKKDAKPSKKKAVKKKAATKKRATAKKKTVTFEGERTVRALYHEILGAFREIRSKNRSMVIKFLLALSENGGNQTQAALDAGYGGEEDGRSEKDRRHMASVEAARLLGNVRIKKAHLLLCESNDITEIVNKVTNKERIVALLVDHALANFYTSPTAFKGDMELVAKLKGYMAEEDAGNAGGDLVGITVRLPRLSQRNQAEFSKLQEQGHFEGEIIEGEVVESKEATKNEQ